MATVFIPQQPYGKNLEPAKAFGRLNVVFRHSETQPPCDYDKMFHRLVEELKDFDPEDDYLLNLGDPHVCGMAYAILLDAHKGRFKLLKWVRKSQEYVETEVDVSW